MELVYNKSSTNNEYTKFINEMKQGSKKKSTKALHKDLNILKNKYCFMMSC